MSDNRPAEAGVSVGTWLARVHDALGEAAGAAISPDEQTVLLDLARVAAHRSERITAPLTTFLAGVAYGSLPEGERLEALRSLLSTLET